MYPTSSPKELPSAKAYFTAFPVSYDRATPRPIPARALGSLLAKLGLDHWTLGQIATERGHHGCSTPGPSIQEGCDFSKDRKHNTLGANFTPGDNHKMYNSAKFRVSILCDFLGFYGCLVIQKAPMICFLAGDQEDLTKVPSRECVFWMTEGFSAPQLRPGLA